MITNEDREPAEKKRTAFDTFTEIMGWLQIAVSPLLISLLIGTVVYFSNSTPTGLTIAILIVAAGLITGIVWATRTWKKKGTINFISGITATPELDEPEPGEKTPV